MKAFIAALPLLALLAACDRNTAPADEVVQTAAEVVGAEKPEAPKLAEGRFAPRDDCADLKGADEFLRNLARAVTMRDTDALVGMAAEDVKLDFGGGSGTAELRKRLGADDRKLWQELAELLKLGCAANKAGGLTLPWYFEQDFGTVDPANSMMVVGEGVPLLDTPEEDAATLETLSWDLVRIAALQPDDEFQRVETDEGVKGYVATDKLRSLIDYRLLASSRNGKWRIVSLVSGD